MTKSPLASGIALANSMIGSSMILFPVTFNQTGILINVLFVLFMAAIMALTCKLLMEQLRHDQDDTGLSIKRRLGPRFALAFGLLSSVTLFLVSSVFFLLAVDVFYDVFLQMFGDVSLSEKAFKLIILGVFAALNYLPDLKYFFKLAPVAMSALVISTLVLIISIAFNTDNITSDFISVKPLSAKDLLGVASINGFAFICHPNAAPIVQGHQKKEDKVKAVYYGYGLTVVLYLLVGVLGAMSIYGRVPPMDKSSYNIIDFYSGSFQAPVIGFLTFIYLFMISPIFPFVSKNQALELIPKEKRQKIPKLWLKATLIFSVLWIAVNIAFILLDTAATTVIGFIATVSVFYITYFLPVFMTLKIGDYVETLPSSNDHEESLIVPDEPYKYASETAATTDQRVISKSSLLTEEQQQASKVRPLPKWQRILYASILGYGTLMLIFELISFFV